jgi:3',5'-cyclic AMP phosphodiesterase CpdA
MRLLVISDLHIGIKAMAKDLCPYPSTDFKDEKLVEKFLEYLDDYQKRVGTFDYLVIPGDITHQSNLSEYDCGQAFLNRVLTRIGLTESEVVFVPGNHDVDWSVLEGKTIYDAERNFRKRHKYNTLKDSGHIFSRLASGSLVSEPYTREWNFPGCYFLGFNSSWHDDSLQDSHYGLIEIEQVQQLKKVLQRADLNNKVKIFVVHHHVYPYNNPHPSWREFSCMQNAQALIDLLAEFQFDFVIHGHRHVPFFSVINPNGTSMINLLCSGSYSCEVPSQIAGIVGNTFHIIEIEDTDCKGRVLSLAYDPTKPKWVESRENHGITFENPFGNNTPIEDIVRDCSTQIDLLDSIQPVIFYNSILKSLPDLKYLPLVKRDIVFDRLEIKYNIKRGNVGTELIFLRNE